MTSSQLLVLLHFNQTIDDSLHLANISPANICVHPNCYMYDNQETEQILKWLLIAHHYSVTQTSYLICIFVQSLIVSTQS